MTGKCPPPGGARDEFAVAGRARQCDLSVMLLAADAILVLHILFVAFVGLGLVLILVGGARGWGWVRNFRFRLLHLLAIGVVVAQSWLGLVCPLTEWEMALRARAGGEVYAGSFIAHWLHGLLYYRAPDWVFALCYTLFALLVLASWRWVKPTVNPPAKPRVNGGDK